MLKSTPYWKEYTTTVLTIYQLCVVHLVGDDGDNTDGDNTDGDSHDEIMIFFVERISKK